MNTFGSTKSNNSRKNILGLFEDEFESESSIVSTITSTIASVAKDMVGGAYEAAFDLSKTVVITESQTESNGKFPASGSIEFNNKEQTKQLQKQKEELDQRQKAEKKRVFYQVLKEDQEKARTEKEKQLFEEEVNDMVANLPTEQKNELLHYQASYKDRSIYQQAELRKKLIEQREKQEKEKQEASIAATNPKQFVGENDLQNREGGSQLGGVGDVSPG